MVAPTETLRNNADEHGGGWQRFLFSPLQAHTNEPEVKRIERVLELLVAAQRHWGEWVTSSCHLGEIENCGVPEFVSLFDRVKESERAYHRTLDALNAALRQYRWGAHVRGDFQGFRSEFEPLASRKEDWSNWESIAVTLLLKYANNPGELSRLRRCFECHGWFHAIRWHQRFCGDSCRRRHAAQDPTFKEKRATYMRERYRPQQKELEKRSLTLAKRNRQTKGRG